MNLNIGKNYKKTCYDYLISNDAGKAFNIYFYGGKMNFNKFCIQVDYCTRNMLDAGIKENTVVTICLPNCPQMQIAFYALSRIGAVVSMVSPLLSQKRIAEIMEKTASSVLIKADISDLSIENVKIYNVKMSHFMGALAKLIFSKKEIYHNGEPFERFLTPTSCTGVPYKTDVNKPFGLFHSGGTTGEPKTVMLSQKAINYCAYTISDNLIKNGIGVEKGTCLHALPLFYGYGLGVMHTELCNGMNFVLQIKFSASASIKCMRKYGVELFFGIPVMYKRMIETGKFNSAYLPRFRLAYTGSESASQESFDYFATHFDNAYYIEGYGLTECVTAFVACDKKNIKLGSCGKPNSQVSIETVDENGKFLPRNAKGELCVSTEALMLGYFNDAETSEKVIFEYGGRKWLKTGDFGYVDDDGFVFIIQRIKNIIKRNAINIYPSQVESCIKKLAFVKECAVFGAKDDSETERIVAAIALNDDKAVNGEPENEIKEFVKQEMGILSTPERIIFCEALPRTTVGKVDVNKLKESLKG